MDREPVKPMVDQSANEYSRASEMYAFVSALVIAATTRSGKKASTPAAAKLDAGAPGKPSSPLFTTVNSARSPARQRQGRRLFSQVREEMQQLAQMVQDTPVTEPVAVEMRRQQPVITKEKIVQAQEVDKQFQSIKAALQDSGKDAEAKYMHRWAARNYEVDEEGALIGKVPESKWTGGPALAGPLGSWRQSQCGTLVILD